MEEAVSADRRLWGLQCRCPQLTSRSPVPGANRPASRYPRSASRILPMHGRYSSDCHRHRCDRISKQAAEIGSSITDSSKCDTGNVAQLPAPYRVHVGPTELALLISGFKPGDVICVAVLEHFRYASGPRIHPEQLV